MRPQINHSKYFLYFFLLLIAVGSYTPKANSQQSLIFTERTPDFYNALQLYQKEKYYAAQESFKKVIESSSDRFSEVSIDAEFYNAMCAVHLFHNNAAALLRNFIERHPDSPHRTKAFFELANYKFRKKDYEDVIDFLNQVSFQDLSQEDQAEYYFKRGYSHFQLDEFAEAANNFYEIKDTDNPYVSAARYYYAHVAYQDGKYQTAAQNFQKINEDPQFGPLVPYYLTQIYYLQKKYDELLAYAPAVLDSAPPKRELEIRKLIGDAYFQTGKYEEASPYLQAYLSRKTGSKQDYYQLGLSYFKTKAYTQAVANLEKSIGDNDTLDQSAYYYIGESNIKNGDKRAAKDALRSAYKLGVDDEITEDALFNYAKVAYELSYHPYDDAILAFEEYINTYPKSLKIKDAYEYLVGVYYTTKNYEEAFKSLNRIKSKDIEVLQARQRVAYYRGVELFNEGNYLDAVDKFQFSLNHNYEPKLRAGAQFWMAEAFFRLGDYDNSANYYSDFLSSSGARSLDYYNKGYYNLGYVYYEKRKYKSAIFWLNSYVEAAHSKNKGLINDAFLRIGDSYFIQKQYENAIKAYNRAAKIGVKDKDYALLQSAISSGVLGNYNEKANKLKDLVNKTSKSVYKDDALFELGKTYLLINQSDEALAYLNQLINDYPNSNYLAEAYLKIGLIYFNKKEDDLALNSYDQVIKKYPSSSAAKSALDKVRKIFIDKGDAEGFENYINGVPFADISKSKLDSTAYVIAENHFLEGDCEKATRDFTNYIKRYPNGIFSLNARFYRANCEAKSGFDQEAAADYRFVIDRPANKFSEKALVGIGKIYRSMGMLDSAAVIYRRLLETAERTENLNMAQLSLMQIYFEKEEFNNAAEYASVLLDGPLLPSNLWQQAQLIMAKTSFEAEDYETSKTYLDTLISFNSEIGAEAKYLLAQTYFLEGNYEKSDTLVYQLVDQVPSFPYWIAKGFILLADNFVAKGDLYNARITFQSVIDNADDEALISIAKEKLEILKASEAENDKEEDETIEVEFDTKPGDSPDLFDSDTLKINIEKEDGDED